VQRERNVSIVLQTAEGPLPVPVRIPEPGMRLADLAVVACALTQAIAERAEARVRETGRAIPCRAGCGACCRPLVPISPPEALRLADVIDAGDEEPRAERLRRFAAAEAALAPHRVAERLAQSHGSADALRLLANAYFARGVACPFLVDEACSIHPQRPVACRSHGVTSPAAWCSEPLAHAIERVPMPPYLSVPLARVTAALTGEPAAPIALALLPSWLRTHGELRERTWPSAALLERFLAEMGAWPERPGEADEGAPVLA
jgi:Fe-S-cluster containining protein